MIQSFLIEGRLAGLNEVTDANRTNPYKGAKLKQEQMDIVRMYIRQSHLQKVTRPVRIVIEWTEPNLRRDIDNIGSAKKFIFDALVQEDILPDDSRKWVVGYTDLFSEPDKKNPRILVIIDEEEE